MRLKVIPVIKKNRAYIK